MGATAELCGRIAGLGYGDLDEAARAAARRLALDGLAVAVAGAKLEHAPRALCDVLEAQGSSDAASVIGMGRRLGPIAAAYVNGASMHVLDYEPMWSPANHAASTTLPAALAAAEFIGADGRSVLAALALGVEMQGRLRVASRMLEPRAFTFHPPGFVGPLAAAVAAGHVLGLDAGQLRHALGIAASKSGTVLANAGTMTKCLHCGQAAAFGLEAALLARAGFTANENVLEAPAGYGAALMPNADWSELQAFGRPWRLVEPGYAIKMFPCQYGTHFGVTAALELARRIGEAAAIEAVTIDTPAMPYVDRPQPANGLDGKFSFQYTAACALLDGRVDMASFTDARRFAPDMAALLPRIRVVQDASRPAAFETMHVAVTARLRDGREVTARCDAPRGYPLKGAPLGEAEHRAKARDCLAVALSAEPAERALALASALDALDPTGLAELCALLR